MAISGSPPAAEPPRPRRILVVDDDRSVRTTLVALLEAAGHIVIDAESGTRGLQALASSPVDLVITDLGMPDMSGWEVASLVKAQAPGTPVVLLTGWGEEAAADHPAGFAVDRVIRKPVRMHQLLAVIGELLGPP